MLQVLGQAARALGVAGKLAMLPILLLALIVGLTSRGIVRSFSVPSASENVTPTPKDRTAEMAARVEQFRGRSLFFIPGPPPREAPVVIEDRPPPVDPGPPPPPSRYAGPAIIAMINETVWFADGRRLTVGADAERGLRVVRVEPPWRAIVEWSGAEFTVNFFEQDKIVLPEPARPAPATASNESEVKS